MKIENDFRQQQLNIKQIQPKKALKDSTLYRKIINLTLILQADLICF